MNKKRVLLLLTAITLLFSLFSCTDDKDNSVKNREYNAAEVEQAAKVLIEKSLSLNEILYGKGLEWEEGDSKEIYKKASSDSLNHYGINTVSELKQKISEVFSTKYIELLNKSDVFSSVKDDDSVRFYTRYFDDEDESGNTCIFVYTEYDYVLKNSYEYITEPKAVRSEGDLVIVKATVRASIMGENGQISKVRDFEHEIKMIEENGAWRLDSETYIVYDEYRDKYENMNK
ncbi:MAG: hypothetical protein J6D20_03250 [Clostridia bacterium]|nr:hypothetical protein [Clostridia bacterium]